MQDSASTRVAPSWHVTGASVRGASHVRGGLANQDAIATWSSGDPAAPVAIVTVADGHGGARHFRSAIGSRMAVDHSLDVLREMAPRFDAASDAERSRITAIDVPLRIVKAWTDAANAHLAANPITSDEWLALEAADGAAALELVRQEPLFAYGATLLTMLVTRHCIVLTQLGDGDILAVDADGTTTRPVPSDERLVGNLTTSLCRGDAASDFRCAVIAIDHDEPPLVLLSTDGYANSFRSDGDFLQVGHDLLDMIRKDGIDAVSGQLPSILEHASTHGSGDDITLGLVYRAADAQDGGGHEHHAARLHHPLNAAEGRIRSLKRALTIAVLVAAAAVGWVARDRLFAPFVATSEPPKGKPVATPKAPVAAPALTPAKPVANVEPPVVGEIVNPVIDEMHTGHGEKGIDVTAIVTFAQAGFSGCVAEATAWDGKDQKLATHSAKLESDITQAPLKVPLVVHIPYKDRAKALKAKDVKVSLSLACSGLAVAEAKKQRVGT